MTKQTKIIATISDRKSEVGFLKNLIEEGVNVFRLNTAHQTPEDTLAAVKRIRKASPKVPIIVDTKGPEVRTTPLASNPIEVKSGDKLKFIGGSNKETSKKTVYLNYDNFHKDVPKGASILYDDGEIEFIVVDKKPTHLIVEVQNDGKIKGKKSVNVPNVDMKLPSLTKKDKEYVEFCAKNNIDFIAHSFIRNKKDIAAVQKILDKFNSDVKIIAKIENQQGVDNIDEILDCCYGIMVARGDLAIEIPAQKVPSVQKMIIKKCIKQRKIVITATQMLHTMIENPRPTRAEISDIANAVYDGTDCLMLSGETAYGKYPIEAVKVMTKVAREVEAERPLINEADEENINEIPNILAQAAVKASLGLPIKAILTDTLSGRTAKYLSAFRGKPKIYAACYNDRVMRELAFSYGVEANRTNQKQRKTVFKKMLRQLVKSNTLKATDHVVITQGNFGPDHGASSIEISQVQNLIR